MGANETKNMPIAQAWMKCGDVGTPGPNINGAGIWTYRCLSGFRDVPELVIIDVGVVETDPMTALDIGVLALTLDQPLVRAECVISAQWTIGLEGSDVNPTFYGSQVDTPVSVSGFSLAAWDAFKVDPTNAAVDPTQAPVDADAFDPFQVIVINIANGANANGPGDLLVNIWSTPQAGTPQAPVFFS